MATSQKLKNHFLTCQICFEVYQKPCTLDCQHTYCEGCLTRYIKTQPGAVKTKSIPCPSCRRHIRVPHPDISVEDWAVQFKPGLVIQGLMDSFAHDLDICSVCKGEGKTTPATHWCTDCEGGLCDGCLKLHHKMPVLRSHTITDLAGDTPREQVKKKSFVCKEHDKKIKLFCKDCKKTLCTVCCSVDHRACKDVVTIQAMLPQVKQVLVDQQKTITEKSEATSRDIVECKNKMNAAAKKITKVKTEIKQAFKTTVDLLQKIENELLSKVDAIQDRQTEELAANIKCKEISRQTYQQQSQFIQQALKFEDEEQLYGMYLSGAVAGDTETGNVNRTDVPDIHFTYNMEKLRENIDMMDVKTAHGVDLTAQPVLQEVVDMKLGGPNSHLRDIVVLNNNGIKTIVVSDYSNRCIKSVYMKSGNMCSSTLTVEFMPWSLAVFNPDKLFVSGSTQILTAAINPDLALLSAITTSKTYYGLAVLDESTLVAGSISLPSVDVLDMTGNVLRSFTTLTSIQKSFSYPYYFHVTNNGNILVSDKGMKSVVCLTPTGEVVFQYCPTGDRELQAAPGITTTTAGDILLADRPAHKIIHLNKSGKYVKDIITSKYGLDQPCGVCEDDNKLYVATWYKEVLVFRFN